MATAGVTKETSSVDCDPRLNRKEKVRTGETARQIRVPIPLAEDLGLVPEPTSGGSQPPTCH